MRSGSVLSAVAESGATVGPFTGRSSITPGEIYD
jgi:hypothetical protein